MAEYRDILICVPNWVGDNLMCMSAVQAFKRNRRDCRVSVMVKSGLSELWEMCPQIDKVECFDKTAGGTLAAALRVRRAKFDEAYVFPNSFRSALMPFLGGVPRRVGSAGHHRAWMLTEVIDGNRIGNVEHQSEEYFAILGLESGGKQTPAPSLSVPVAAEKSAMELMARNGREVAGFMPGAAFGLAKQWPLDHWIELGRHLKKECGAEILVFGLHNERELCGRVASAIDNAEDLCGQTSLAELAALIGHCRVVVCNDSGGMHLAAAVGTPVVAVFGMTDPVKTAPLGRGHTVIAARGVDHNRDIGKDCPDAIAAMRSIRPAEVLQAVKTYWSDRD